LSVEIALTKGAGSDNVEGQVLRFELDLTLSQLNFNGGFHVLFLHEYAFGTRYPNLKSACLGVTEFSGCLLSCLLIDIADAVSKTKVVALYVWETKLNLVFGQCENVLAGGEALTLASVPFQNVLFFVEVAHILNNIFLAHVKVGVVTAEEPS
jgi:hypothetical protein